MNRIDARIDSHIRVNVNDLPEGAIGQLVEALSIPNKAKAEAQKQHQWGWESLPDYIAMHRFEGDVLVMPRGFAHTFNEGMMAYGYKVHWIDRRQWKSLIRVGNKIETRPYQTPAKHAIIQHEQGFYKAPAGSGKTVTVLASIQTLGCKSLVIVNTKDILWQWQERAAEFLGPDYPVGQIGDNIFDVSQYLTIATAQTLHRRYDQLEAEGFFDIFSFVCLDEAHHATADTYNRVVDRFSARYRIGVSATPDKTGDFALATNVLGPIFHTTKPADVPDLMRPKVVRVPTKFGFGFRGTKSRWQRSNYPQMIQALVTNEDRNRQIVEKILANQGHHQLVISKRLEHLAILYDMVAEAGFSDPMMMLTGQDDNDARKEAKALAENHPCVIFSTLADEAMDIPRLDRLHLTFPQKNSGLVTQQVGRVERVHPDKKDAIIYDYADLNVGPLEKQWKTRRIEVYMPRSYEINLEVRQKD